MTAARFVRALAAAALCVAVAAGAAQPTPLEEMLGAVQKGNAKAVQAWLERGMDPNSVDPKGFSLLMLAARENHREVVIVLLDRKAKINQRSAYGDSALMLASFKGNLDMVQLLVSRGAEVQHSGWAPLHYAAFEGRAEVIRFLLGKGADKDAVAPNGYSPLMLAVLNKHLAAAQALLFADVEVNLRGPKGETALGIALPKAEPEMIELLRRAGGVE
jgi:ankyrin repeat protein